MEGPSSPKGRAPLSSTTAWEALADLERFACLDHFHRSVEIDGETPRQGADIRIEHRMLGVGFWRVGRILRWQPGRGWAFSDLSAGGKDTGFPHVFQVEVAPSGPESCTLDLAVTGSWTARFLPRWAVRLWLGWNFVKIRTSFENVLLSHALGNDSAGHGLASGVDREPDPSVAPRSSAYPCGKPL